MVKNVKFFKPRNSAKIRDQKVQFLSNEINRLKSEGKSVSNNRPSVPQHRGSPEGVHGHPALSYSTWLLFLTTFSACCRYTARVCWHVHIPFATKIIQCYKSTLTYWHRMDCSNAIRSSRLQQRQMLWSPSLIC